jgi:hypothetical protein
MMIDDAASTWFARPWLQRVWDYVNHFSEWMPFDHRVKAGRCRLTPC